MRQRSRSAPRRRPSTSLRTSGGAKSRHEARLRRPRPHHLLREIRLPRLRLHHRRDRAAPVLLQRAAGRLPGLRRPRRETGVRRGPRRPQPHAVDRQGRGRALGQVQPASALLHAGAVQPRPRLRLRPHTSRGRTCPRKRSDVVLHGTPAAPSPSASSTAGAATRSRSRSRASSATSTAACSRPNPPGCARSSAATRAAARARSATAPASSPRRSRQDRRRGHHHVHPPQRRRRLRLVRAASHAKLTATQNEIAKAILKEINERLGFLHNVGLDYLHLDRTSGTLSRRREPAHPPRQSRSAPASRGVLYVLDEPSIGLHQKDNDRLLETLKRLQVARQHRARRRA